jgi:hypothetical protein
MNDNEVELRLQRLFRDAQVVRAPDNLRQVVVLDRSAQGTTDLGRRRTASWPGRTWLRPGTRAAWSLVGLAATLVLVAALLAVGARPPVKPTASGTGPEIRVDWRGIPLPYPHLYGLGFMTELNGKLIASLSRFGQDQADSGTGDSVWSYDSATGQWAELATPEVLVGGRAGVLARVDGLVPDGQGGLYAFGSTEDGLGAPTAMIWHSSDGRSWESTELGVGEIRAIFVRPGAAIAVGDAGDFTGCALLGRVTSWTSTDRQHWTEHSIGEPPYEYQGAVELNGRLVVTGTNACQSGAQDHRFWTSRDGASWQRITSSGFPEDGSYRIFNLWADKDTVLAFEWDNPVRPPMTSSDAASWRSGTLPSNADGLSPTAIVQAGGVFLAVGSAGAVWSSADGESWTLLPENSWFGARGIPYDNGVWPDSVPTPSPVYHVVWADPIVAGDLIAIPNVTLSDGSYGFLLGRVSVEGPATSASP